jgi:hypothetical protein
MTKFLGAAAFLLVLSLPAHAQMSLYGGSLNGTAQVLPPYPTLSISITYATGSPDFVPSSFLNYDQAVTKGKAMIDEAAKPLGEVAKESKVAARPKAKLMIVQDDRGNVVMGRLR